MFQLYIFFILVVITHANVLQPCVRGSQQDQNNNYIINTLNGRVKGNCQVIVTTDAINRTRATNVYSWLSIPFAETPRRFEAPKPKRSWSADHILDGTKYPRSCYQIVDQSQSDNKEVFSGFRMWIPNSNHTRFSEDCLYLNVWLPTSAYRNLTLKQSSRSPIMVFVHGSSGTTALDLYNPAVFVATTGIIVVQITYRTGIFGFFGLGDDLAGNQAILDQHYALRWIHENADNIGGDRDRVTVYAVSIGGMTGGYHLAYKPSWPFFRNMILQSGPPVADALKPLGKQEAEQRNRAFLYSIGCGDSQSTNEALLECARRQNPQTLALESNRFYNSLTKNVSSFQNGLFIPIIDGEIIKESIEDSIKNEEVKKCPILTGFASDEGSMFIAYSGLLGLSTNDIKQKSTINELQYNAVINEKFTYYPRYPYMNADNLKTNVLYKYASASASSNEGESGEQNYFESLNQIIGHSQFQCPTIKFLQLYQKHSDVYMYEYAHRISTSPWPTWYGAVHADELAMVFGQPISNRPYSSAINSNPWLAPRLGYSQAEKLLAQEMMVYLANFIKYNSPNMFNSTHQMSNKHWPVFNSNSNNPRSNDNNYLQFKTGGSRLMQNYELVKCYFWNDFVPKLVQEEQEAQQARSTLKAQNTQGNNSNRNHHQISFTSILLGFLTFFFLFKL